MSQEWSVYLGFWREKSLSKDESLKLDFEPRQSEEILQPDRQRIPDRWSNEAEGVLTERFQLYLR